ncbi:FAD-dependent monooxygenase CTB5 [Cladobotryum mycophilum]|uniref:FAD-dependent monooxygenase CTB5 n=1 Tax=Cladobotryum mycophilum TaxID=491253 RepID=A0ABR0S820_9HYPO
MGQPAALTSQCHELSSGLESDKIFFKGTDSYSSSLSSYFSQQESELYPACIVSPTAAEDVATVLRSLSTTADPSGKCINIAIRSGGHAAHAGAANIENGVTVDLRRLNGIEVSHDRKTVSIGPGATWGDVYSKLDGLGLSVAGGRAAPVGVGGLTTGGGVSYFSPRYGWACDTVSNYQVVLADGSIVNANAECNPDLHVALRGGSNNFGIVTRFDMNAFEQGKLWGGSVYHSLDTIDDNLKAFGAFNSATDYDEYASLITSFGFAAGQGAAIVNSLEYTKPVENPPAFKHLLEIPSLMSTMRISNMSDISKEQGSFSPDGKRQLAHVITHGSTLEMLNATFLRWNQSLPEIENVPNIVWSMSLEPLPPAIYKRATTDNSLGLGDRSKALVITLLTGMWTDKKDDDKVQQAASKMFDDLEADAKRLGEYDPFVYLNYAAPSQDPIRSYGEKSVEHLKRVRESVDPTGFFTHRVPAASVTDNATESTHKPNDAWDGHCYVAPWPGGVYKIIEKSSGRAMALNKDRYICLEEVGDDQRSRNHWQCVEKNGYFGFVNVNTGDYMGRDGKFGLRCWGVDVGVWEFVIPRKNPDGGYELLLLFEPNLLRRICVHEDGTSLQLRLHGITMWEFIKV